MYNLYDRILGSLTAAGIGDAIGAPSEAMSYPEIVKKYGRIGSFVDGSTNKVAFGNMQAEITDDASQMFEMVKAIIKTNGNLTADAAAEALVNWSLNYPRYYPRNAGPTTRKVIEDFKSGVDPVEIGRTSGLYEFGTSNGAIMRIAGAGLLHPGDPAKAVETAITMTKCSHGSQIAYSASCAIACAISVAASEGASVHSILKAAVYGAKEGERIGIGTARIAPGARVLPKILKAIEIGYSAAAQEQAEMLLNDEMGTDSSAIAQTTGIAIGLFVASDGDVMKSVIGGANIGGDTDTIACIVGMISGAFKGYNSIDSEVVAEFERVNPAMEFRWAAKELCRIINEVRV